MLKPTYILLLSIFLATITGAVAHADDQTTYVRALGNLGVLGDTGIDSASLGDGDVEFDVGFGGGAAGGYDFGRWRLEGEVMYRTNTLDTVAGSVYDGADDGDFSSLGIGVNAIVEFDLLANPNITSYAGLGIVWFQEIDIDFETAGGEFSYSGDDTAAQVFFGARYDLQNRWAVSAELRHLFASDLELRGEGNARGRLEADYDRTEFMVGIEYRF